VKSRLPLVLLALSACAVGKPYFPVSYGIRDNVQLASFEVEFQNKTKKPICLNTSNWPSPGGYLEGRQDDVWVNVGGKRFNIAPLDDYCPTCKLKIKPGAAIKATIPYSLFSIPESMYKEKKELNFQAMGYKCSY